jgi:hypothetical protein
MSAASGWKLAEFKEVARRDLGEDLPPALAEKFDRWLESLRQSPFDMHHIVVDRGTYLGDPERGEPREVPHIPEFRAWVEEGFTGETLWCAYVVDPDAQTITCTGLKYLPRAEEWRV